MVGAFEGKTGIPVIIVECIMNQLFGWVFKKGGVPLNFVNGYRDKGFKNLKITGLHMNTIPKGQVRITLKIQELGSED